MQGAIDGQTADTAVENADWQVLFFCVLPGILFHRNERERIDSDFGKVKN